MSNGVSVYRGIPYARAARFRPPEPVPLVGMPPAEGAFGPPAAQNPDPLDGMWGQVLAPGSEDCLTLNVRTPAADAGRRPVMVWIHGGAFVIGSGRWGWYRGSRLVRREGVVLVTLNYRLGAFGFLDLSGVGGPAYADGANCGLLDQVAALEWVRAHIDRFGGDPDRVTVFGESAGGISIGCLLGCPRAAGLFRRAICMSGPPSMVRSRAFAARVTERVMRHAGVETAEQLAALPTAALLAAQARTVRAADFLGELMFGPTVGGTVLPRRPLEAIRAGDAKDVALLTGTTLDEARLWSLYNPILRALPAGSLGRWLRSLGLDPDAVWGAYRRDRPELGLGTLAMAAAGDALFWMPHVRLAEAQARHRPADTRVYLVGWRSPARGGRLGAPHGVDVPMVFGTARARRAWQLVGRDPAGAADRDALSGRMQAAWAEFARTGDPNHPGLPDWPAFDPDRRATMVLDRTPVVRDDPLPAVRRAWDGLSFDGLRPAVEDLPRIRDIARYLLTRGAGLLGGAGLAGLLAWALLRHSG
jgi:para-nitrobenzyl esterase